MEIFIDAKRRSRSVVNSTGGLLNESIAGVESFSICGVESNWHQWSGWLKDFRIYDRVLSQDEIKRAYYHDAYAADFNMDMIIDGLDLAILSDMWLEGDFALADADEDSRVQAGGRAGGEHLAPRTREVAERLVPWAAFKYSWPGHRLGGRH